MYHPLYYRAGRYIGDTVDVYHVTGDIYHGIILSVKPNGLYVLQHLQRVVPAPDNNTDSFGTQAPSCAAENQYNLIYSPVAFFSFGALTGLHFQAP